MEEEEQDQELKFAMGGHMRSHLINSTETDKRLNKKKLSPFNNGGGGNSKSYSLRENPKRTCRFADSNEYKFCKECGKGFQSWKALFGHMKCHSRKLPNSLEEDSWTDQNPVTEVQSDNEAAVAAMAAPHRKKKRSRRVMRRYMATTHTSSSFSVGNNDSSSPVSEIEEEQEEVAMCLMMLSRDLNSVSESSDNNFELLESGPSIPSNGIAKTEGVKLKKLRNGTLESTINLGFENSQFEEKESDFGASGVPRKGPEMIKSDFWFDGLKGNDSEVEDGGGFEASEVELGKKLTKENGPDQSEFTSKKHEFGCSDSSKKLSCGGVWEAGKEKGSEQKRKFDCAACNKTFHSYQALGGHRASHKKIKGCFVSKAGGSDGGIETKISPDSKLTKSLNNGPSDGHKGHECPICFRVFSSGQALGGHKRSHLIIGGSEAKSNQSIAIQKPIQEIRDVLDLNLPAHGEEERSGDIGFRPWFAL